MHVQWDDKKIESEKKKEEKENLKMAILEEARILAKEHGSKDIRFFADSVIKLIEG